MENSNQHRTLVAFAHGKETGPWGSKIKNLAAIAERMGAQVVSPDYSDLADPDARVKRLLGLVLPAYDRLVLVGSSMGGYVSCVASMTLKPQGLFLLAPAVGLQGYEIQNLQAHVQHLSIVMGWQDEVIPVQNIIAFAQSQRADLHLLDADHRLDGVLQEVGFLFEQFLRKVMA
jgi:alpha-beta hydrolase superfamily lysophospholipase